VHTIQPRADSSSMEEFVELFSVAFEQICTFKVVDALVAIGWNMS
jgi:hypothetical protein